MQASLPDTPCTIQCASSFGPWLSAGAILISAFLAAGIALLSIGAQRSIARKRATLDLLSQKEWDKDYISAKNDFNRLRDATSGLMMWADPEHRNSDQVNIIRNTLNDYELIAVGIKEGILDEDLYKRWFRSSLMKDWRAAKPFVTAIRRNEGVSTIFSEFQWLAEKWIAEREPELPNIDGSSPKKKA